MMAHKDTHSETASHHTIKSISTVDGIVRSIDTLIRFEIECRFAYFLGEPARVEEAVKNIIENKEVLTGFINELSQQNAKGQPKEGNKL
jgi:hypothetical protein